MKYTKSTMLKLVNEERELHDELKKIKSEMGLEKNRALKALYHSVVADGGRFQTRCQELDR
ncbi:hypothetical protein QUF56_16365 [Ureibacillus composti]|nr:hypothetical protein [Ureibacillus composti]